MCRQTVERYFNHKLAEFTNNKRKKKLGGGAQSTMIYDMVAMDISFRRAYSLQLGDRRHSQPSLPFIQIHTHKYSVVQPYVQTQKNNVNAMNIHVHVHILTK